VESDSKLKRELDSFVTKAVARARAVSGPQLELDDLRQVAQLAILEAESKMPRLDRAHHLRFLRKRVVSALKAEVDLFARREPADVTLDVLIEDETRAVSTVGADRLWLEWDGETSDEAASKNEVAEHVREVVAGMPADTAQVVRLCFGLDGGDVVEPIDVADILDEAPETVFSHLSAAERLFRHFSSDGHHRRLTPMTDLEFQAFYSVGDLAWYDLRDVNLNNADLRECDLSNAILSGMNLWGAKLAEGKAHGANLWGAQLDGADLRDADLRSVNLERASLRGADLRGVYLVGANLWGADLTNARVDHADLRQCDLRSADLTGTDLTRANLSGADLRNADLRRSKLVGAELVGANLQGVELANADFRWADLRNSDLCWSNLSVADMRGASMEGAVRSPKMNDTFAGRAPKPSRMRPVADSA
jgi:uncharacterized protein YjbI with pentapeptide repeats/DNA-directed RNA polymerase specialized sigma24 family protein